MRSDIGRATVHPVTGARRLADIFEPLALGDLMLPNRIFMAPLTRCRAGGGGRVPNALMAEYYRQRATAGLILTEATSVTHEGVGYPDTPGIWSDEQVEGWTLVTDAVHAAGGRIFLQLWHVGRVSDPSYLGGRLPVAPSAIRPAGHVSLVRPTKQYETPRALESTGIAMGVAAYRRGAENAERAGFDGVEVHGANGYLLDQFLQDKTNRRDDDYGGPVENRARLMLEVTDACVAVWGASRVGMHLAPRRDAHDMGDSDPEGTFGYVARALADRKIGFICSREKIGHDSLAAHIKREFGGLYVENELFSKADAVRVLDDNEADAVAFGKLFIANPDLVRRFREDAALNAPRPELFYAPGPEGYTDYPSLDAA